MTVNTDPRFPITFRLILDYLTLRILLTVIAFMFIIAQMGRPFPTRYVRGRPLMEKIQNLHIAFDHFKII